MDISLLEDLSGKTYGRLTVISFALSKDRKRFWNCKCSCGKNHITNTTSLKNGSVKSCGCARHEALIKGKHHRCGTREYVIWASMKQRCSNPKVFAYHRYGGRGISVCDRWVNSFQNFLSDMGEAPTKEHTLDRIDVNGNYEPNNCKWSTHKEQSNNRVNTKRITLKGVTKCLEQWSQELSISRNTLYSRVNRCRWGDEKALMAPVIKRGTEPTIDQNPDEETATCATCNRLLPVSAFGNVTSSYCRNNGEVVIYVNRRKYCRKCRQVSRKI